MKVHNSKLTFSKKAKQNKIVSQNQKHNKAKSKKQKAKTKNQKPKTKNIMKIVIPKKQQRLAHPKRHKCQFNYKKQEWSEDQKTVKAKLPGKEGKQTFEDKKLIM